MSSGALTIDSLRLELEAFAKNALTRELSLVREHIVNELRGTDVLQRHPSSNILKHPRESKVQREPTNPSIAVKDLVPSNHSNDGYSYVPMNDFAAGHPLIAAEREDALDKPLENTRSISSPEIPFARTVLNIVNGSSFHNFIGLVVMINVLMLGAETDYIARNWSTTSPAFFSNFELGFATIFTCEITGRLYAYGCGIFFSGPEWKWNIFDFTLVFLQVSELMFKELGPQIQSGNSMSFLRGLRMARVARASRMLHLVPDFRMLLVSIFSSLKSLFYVFLLILVTVFVFGIIILQVVNDHKIDVGREVVENEQAKLEEYFGSLDRAMLSMYQTISEGIHWGELNEPLMEFCSPWLTVLLIFYTGFVIFAMMNVVTSFFVEAALRVAQSEGRANMLRKLQGLFEDANEDKDTIITEKEFLSLFGRQEFVEYLAFMDLTPEDVLDTHFFALIDTDGSGGLDSTELIRACLRLTGSAKAVEVAGLQYEFRLHKNFVEESFGRLLAETGSSQ